MRRTILLLALTFFCFALRAQDTQDSLAYLLEEPQPTVDDGQATEEVSFDDNVTEDYDAEETTGEEIVTVEPDALQGTIDYKSQKVSVRKFDEEKWETIAGAADYEEKPVEKPEKKPDEKTKEKTEENANFPAESSPWSGEILRTIAFVVIIAIVLALLYFLLKNTTFETKLRKKSFEVKDWVAQVENIDDLDIQTLLQRTLAEGNLRLAVRLYYLGLLKKLNDVGLITWKRDKTNRDYLSELFPREDYFKDVKKLTLAYEQVWYGEHAITRESFQTLSASFETVDQKLNAFKPL